MKPLLISCGRYDANMMEYLAECMRKREIGYAHTVDASYEDFSWYDCVLILGDKYEHLQNAMDAYEMDVPVCHLHGGEDTYAHKDQGFRYAISNLSEIHFAATSRSRDKLTRLGFQNVHCVGALGVEILLGLGDLPAFVDTGSLSVGIAHNPQEGEDPTEIVKACNKLTEESHRDVNFYVTAPFPYGGLRGGNVRWWKSMGMKYYQLLMQADVMIGNSSSLVVEAPVAGCGIVLVGDRQKGRELASNIIESPCESSMIVEAVEKALGTDPVEPEDHPYFLPNTSDRIIKILEERWPEQT